MAALHRRAEVGNWYDLACRYSRRFDPDLSPGTSRANKACSQAEHPSMKTIVFAGRGRVGLSQAETKVRRRCLGLVHGER